MHDHHPHFILQEAGGCQTVLKEAKRLHKAAASEQLALSLPVLRRILASEALQRISLPELRRHRSIVQRKHILRMLAAEAGFNSWEAYRQALAGMAPEQLAHFDIARHQAGQLNLWFSTLAQAQAHAALHGGRALQVGRQGVVLIDS
jgi:hypothetical protein